jgi:hypothetical protein
MTEDEQKFWDAAYMALASGAMANADPEVPEWDHIARFADKMLAERRKRQKTFTPA